MSIDLSPILVNPNSIITNYNIPIPDSSITGSEFVKCNMSNSIKEREENILNNFLLGNVPSFLRDFVPITITLKTNSITYLCTSDCLSIGTDDDYVRMPMNPLTAQKIADKYDCSLPTRKIVNDVWKNAVHKLTPLPWGPPYDKSMLSTYRFNEHNKRIQKQLVGKDYTKLISGHKKDVVLTNKLFPNNPKKRVAIYGWIKSNGCAIQNLNPSSHEVTYADYSHQVMLIMNDVVCNSKLMRIQDVFTNPDLCALISDEGILKFIKY
jgi:hypothetical protein